jgi:predicted NAD/FAD-dependent oxidoreductase
MKRNCLMVGAGMAGLTAAAELTKAGWQAVLVDKGRGVGGRMATRRLGDCRLDHGAQFFTVRDAEFRAKVDGWEREGLVSPWFEEGGHTRYRSADGMNALAKHLAKPFDVRTEVKLEFVEPAGTGWRAVSDTGAEFTADALLMTAPAPQAIALLARCALPAEIEAALKAVDFDPCFALLVTLEGASLVPAPGYIRPESGPIEWLADNAMKGISAGPAALTIHARGDFSRQYRDAPKDEVAAMLLAAAEPWMGSAVTASQLHRWLYSKPVAGEGSGCLFTSSPAPLAVAGDAYAGGRVEGAFVSGLAAARALIDSAIRAA